MEFLSCDMIAGNFINITGNIVNDSEPITLCCEALPDIPAMGFGKTPEETLRSFLGMRTQAVLENMSDQCDRTVTAGCMNCANFRDKEYAVGLPIAYVNLSMSPAPCQCRCIYCGQYNEKYEDTPEVRAAYEKLFAMLEYGKRSGAISPSARWQISSGEITIHPYHDRIMELIGNSPATFYTNAFKFDEAIADNLHSNPNSAINLSIDCGTAETWKRIKGFDNFEEVMMNLVEYYKRSSGSGQITLKYIVLPDVNDIYEDFESLMEIMEVLDVPYLTISRDTRIKYSPNDETHVNLIGAAAYLVAFCRKHNFMVDLFTYTPQEREEIVMQANEVISRKLI